MADQDSAPRTVSARLTAKVWEQAEIVLSVAVAHLCRGSQESLRVTVDGADVAFEEVIGFHGSRLHLLRAVPVGDLIVEYEAHVTAPPVAPEPTRQSIAADRILFLRPSRYCESDTLTEVAAAEFSGLRGRELLDAVSGWVGRRLFYVSGSSRATDGAVQTYLARSGVCRDFAHLAVALLRARRVPARLVSVYAPGLTPMDFHAVAEAQLDDGQWWVVDATGLAPRQTMLRIATGRDASDTAFLTVHSGRVDFTGLRVTATSATDLPVDDRSLLVRLA